MNDSLTAIVSIINTSVQKLQSAYAQKGLTVPNLDEPYSPGYPDDAQTREAILLINAAATQLIATVKSPVDTILELAPNMYVPALLWFVVDANIPEILDEAPDKSLHARDIAAIANCNPSHISRVLRYLAIRHIFKEVTPDVFSNNRISSALIKENKKSVAELQEKPLEKYDESGLAGGISHFTQEGLKCSTALGEFLKSRGEIAKTPFNLAFDTDSVMWDWFTLSESNWRTKRFASLMQGFGSVHREETFLNAYDWGSFTSADVIVDVGANVGIVTMMLAKNFKEPQYIIQDLPSVIPQAQAFWEERYPEAVRDGQVKFENIDFFASQPVKGAAVYFLRFIIHDWPDAKAIEILKHIRDAASPSSKLIIFEMHLPYACKDPGEHIKVAEIEIAPYPLLPYPIKGFSTQSDIHMMAILDGQERNLNHFVALGEASGWKFEAVKAGDVFAFIFSPQE